MNEPDGVMAVIGEVCVSGNLKVQQRKELSNCSCASSSSWGQEMRDFYKKKYSGSFKYKYMGKDHVRELINQSHKS
jgi:hypothetical protein